MSTLCYALRNGVVFNGPFEYNKALVESILMKNGADPRVATPLYSRPIQSNNILILKQEEVKPVFDSESEFLSISNTLITPTAVRIEYTVETKALEDIFKTKERKLAHYHEVYDMGITLHENVKVRTNVEARVNIIGIVNAMSTGDLTETLWNGIGGQLYIGDVAQAKALNQAILTHISKGFMARSSLQEEMLQMDVDQLKSLNVLLAYRDKLEALGAFTESLESEFKV